MPCFGAHRGQAETVMHLRLRRLPITTLPRRRLSLSLSRTTGAMHLGPPGTGRNRSAFEPASADHNLSSQATAKTVVQKEGWYHALGLNKDRPRP